MLGLNRKVLVMPPIGSLLSAPSTSAGLGEQQAAWEGVLNPRHTRLLGKLWKILMPRHRPLPQRFWITWLKGVGGGGLRTRWFKCTAKAENHSSRMPALQMHSNSCLWKKGWSTSEVTHWWPLVRIWTTDIFSLTRAVVLFVCLFYKIQANTHKTLNLNAFSGNLILSKLL